MRAVAAIVTYGALTAVVIAEAIEEALTRAPHFAAVLPVPDWGWLHFVPLAMLIVFGLGRFYLWYTERERPELRILDPMESAAVPMKMRVTGSAFPAGNVNQVLVKAGGLWHPQPTPIRDGHLWTAECTIGDERTERGVGYQLVALARRARVQRPVRRLPWFALRSQIVTVQRA